MCFFWFCFLLPVMTGTNVNIHHLYCHWQDLDGYQEDDVDGELGSHDGELYFSGAPSGWDDPRNNDVPPPYLHTHSDLQDNNGNFPVSRGDSFISSAMIV